MILEDLKQSSSKIENNGTKANLGVISAHDRFYFTHCLLVEGQCAASHFSQTSMHTRVALLLERENSGFSM
tara:strand:- start:375 stop:587 length:213 start_codon:yes stop_codon:yes gene_type:complete